MFSLCSCVWPIGDVQSCKTLNPSSSQSNKSLTSTTETFFWGRSCGRGVQPEQGSSSVKVPEILKTVLEKVLVEGKGSKAKNYRTVRPPKHFNDQQLTDVCCWKTVDAAFTSLQRDRKPDKQWKRSLKVCRSQSGHSVVWTQAESEQEDNFFTRQTSPTSDWD